MAARKRNIHTFPRRVRRGNRNTGSDTVRFREDGGNRKDYPLIYEEIALLVALVLFLLLLAIFTLTCPPYNAEECEVSAGIRGASTEARKTRVSQSERFKHLRHGTEQPVAMSFAENTGSGFAGDVDEARDVRGVR